MRSLFYIISLFSGCNSFHPNAPEVLIVDVPKSVSTTIDPKDPGYLKVKLFLNNNYQVFLGKDSLTTKNINQIDQFISKRISKINRDKVFVMGDPDTRYPNFSKLKMVFKKYEIFKFSVVTDAAL